MSATPVIEMERLKNVDFQGTAVVRVNVIANIVDKYIQEGEKKFGSITLDDGSGQIKVKSFGDDVDKFFATVNQGDTVMTLGLLRFWNNEIYITPEIIKKKEAEYLLIRKMESEKTEKKEVADPAKTSDIKQKLITMIKDAEKDGGIDIDKLVADIKESSQTVNNEIKKLLEDGIAYEPRPGKVRWLG
jgi:RPA family protein